MWCQSVSMCVLCQAHRGAFPEKSAGQGAASLYSGPRRGPVLGPELRPEPPAPTGHAPVCVRQRGVGPYLPHTAGSFTGTPGVALPGLETSTSLHWGAQGPAARRSGHGLAGLARKVLTVPSPGARELCPLKGEESGRRGSEAGGLPESSRPTSLPSQKER